MDVVIKHLKPVRVAFVRHIGPYTACAPAWVVLCADLERQNLMVDNPLMIGLCHDNPANTAAAKLCFDACATVDADFVPGPGLSVQTIAGGDYACAMHQGPYGEVGTVYDAIYRWCAGAGRTVLAAPSLEVYLNNVHHTAPEDLLTEIYVPLAQA